MKALLLGFISLVLLVCLEESFTSPVASSQESLGTPQLQGKLTVNKVLQYNRDNTANPPIWQFWKWWDRRKRDEDNDLTVDGSQKKDTAVNISRGGFNKPDQAPSVLQPDSTAGVLKKEEIIQTGEDRGDLKPKWGSHSHEPVRENEITIHESRGIRKDFLEAGQEPHITGPYTDTDAINEGEITYGSKGDLDDIDLQTKTGKHPGETLIYDLEDGHGDTKGAEQESHIFGATSTATEAIEEEITYGSKDYLDDIGLQADTGADPGEKLIYDLEGGHSDTKSDDQASHIFEATSTATEAIEEQMTYGSKDDLYDIGLETDTGADPGEKLIYNLEGGHSDTTNAEQASHIFKTTRTTTESTEEAIIYDEHDSHIILDLGNETAITDEDFSYLERVYNEDTLNEDELAFSGEQESSKLSRPMSESDDGVNLFQTGSTDDNSDTFESVFFDHGSGSFENVLYHLESGSFETGFPHHTSSSNENVLNDHESDSLETVLSDRYSSSYDTVYPNRESVSYETAFSGAVFPKTVPEGGSYSIVTSLPAESSPVDEAVLSDDEPKFAGSVEPKFDTPKRVEQRYEPSSYTTENTERHRTGCNNFRKHRLDLFNVFKFGETDDPDWYEEKSEEYFRDRSNNRYGNESMVKGFIIMFWKFVLKTMLRYLGL